MNAKRLLVLGAHPDDAEYHAGGLIARYAELGHAIKLVSVTDGGAGHHREKPEDLVRLRRAEAAAAGRVVGAVYETWDFPDAALEPTLDVRRRIIREIRTFRPDLVLTHRLCDYHPDHRAVGQAVQDASYLVTVPLVLPEVEILPRDPVVAYMVDLFTKPYPLQPDVVIDIGDQLDTVVEMLAQHQSQVFDFLPFNQGIAGDVPSEAAEQRTWLKQWLLTQIGPRRERFDQAVKKEFGEAAAAIQWIEAYEISEYAAPLNPVEKAILFAC